jgi:hypothetical protein
VKKIWYLFRGKMFYLGGKHHSPHPKLNSWSLIPIFATPWIKYHVIGDLFALTFFTSWNLSAYHVITALIHVRIHFRMSILYFDQTGVFSLIDKYDYYSLLCLPPSDNIKILCGTARLLIKDRFIFRSYSQIIVWGRCQIFGLESQKVQNSNSKAHRTTFDRIDRPTEYTEGLIGQQSILKVW